MLSRIELNPGPAEIHNPLTYGRGFMCSLSTYFFVSSLDVSLDWLLVCLFWPFELESLIRQFYLKLLVREKQVSSNHVKLTNENISLHLPATKNKFQNSSSVLIHNQPLVIPLVLTEKTTSNEYLSINSKKRFNKKTVLLHNNPT